LILDAGAHAIATADARAGAPRRVEHAALVEQELDWVHRTLRRLGVRPADCDDLTQDVFLVFVRRQAEYDPERPLRPWLFGIAYRIARDHARRPRRELPTSPMDLDDGFADASSHDRDEARATLLAGLDRVPLERRAVLVAYEIDGVPMAEIARALDIRLFTAYSRLRKARRELAAAVSALAEEGAP
jgi:RNA polymerase sigma-70 factor, ECF subfamily